MMVIVVVGNNANRDHGSVHLGARLHAEKSIYSPSSQGFLPWLILLPYFFGEWKPLLNTTMGSPLFLSLS